MSSISVPQAKMSNRNQQQSKRQDNPAGNAEEAEERVFNIGYVKVELRKEKTQRAVTEEEMKREKSDPKESAQAGETVRKASVGQKENCGKSPRDVIKRLLDSKEFRLCDPLEGYECFGLCPKMDDPTLSRCVLNVYYHLTGPKFEKLDYVLLRNLFLVTCLRASEANGGTFYWISRMLHAQLTSRVGVPPYPIQVEACRKQAEIDGLRSRLAELEYEFSDYVNNKSCSEGVLLQERDFQDGVINELKDEVARILRVSEAKSEELETARSEKSNYQAQLAEAQSKVIRLRRALGQSNMESQQLRKELEEYLDELAIPQDSETPASSSRTTSMNEKKHFAIRILSEQVFELNRRLKEQNDQFVDALSVLSGLSEQTQ